MNRITIKDKQVFWGSNIINFITITVPVSMFFYLIFSLNNKEYRFFILTIYVLTEYLLSLYFINIFFIYNDKILIFYPTRFFSRKVFILYSKLHSVFYLNYGSKAATPNIIFKFSAKKTISLPSNSFPCFSFKKRKAILKFLASKGIPIEINSVFEKDENILA